VTFVTFNGFTVLFGGDMECAGWKALLRLPAFRARLAAVKVFVASHHGRENGCCDELFLWMRPELVIFSDCAIKHGTQEATSSWYAARTSGIPDWTRPKEFFEYETRKVMTTRCDGKIMIDVGQAGRYLVTREGGQALASIPTESWARLLALETWR